MRQKIILVCSVCLARNYQTTAPSNRTERMELKKHCPTCNRTTVHKQSR